MLKNKFIYFLIFTIFNPLFLFSAEQNHYKLYDINKSVEGYLYHIKEEQVNGEIVHKWEASKAEDDVDWKITLNEHDLVSAEEILGPDGKYYLRIPYGDPPNTNKGLDDETPYFLIPEYPNGKKNEDQVESKPNYRTTVAGEKRIGAIIDNREDKFVYLDLPYEQRIPLTVEPQTDVKGCKEPQVTSQCLSWPNSQVKLKVIDTKVLLKDEPDSKKQFMQLYYKVEYEYLQKKCTETPIKDSGFRAIKCSKQKTLAQGWIPYQRALDFKRDYANKEEFSPIREKKDIRKMDSKVNEKKPVKDLPKVSSQKCALEKQFYSNLEDLNLVLKQASQYPIDPEEFGACVGKDHIKKMKDSNDRIEAKYQNLIDEAQAENPKNYSKILKLKNKKNIERLKKLGQLWRQSKTPFDAYLRKHWDDKYSASETKNTSYSKAQMLSIDTLARSLYGEMREVECSGDTSSYYKEIARVMINRAAMIKKKGGPIEAFISNDSINALKKNGDLKKVSIFEILPHVISSPSQISSWNANDDNLINNLCPDPQSSENNSAAWEMAKAVAIEAVLNTNTFLSETKNIGSSLFYASKIRPKWEDDKRFTKLGRIDVNHVLVDSENKKIKIYNKGIYNPSCVKLYKNSDYMDELIDIQKNINKYYTNQTQEIDIDLRYQENKMKLCFDLSF
jgi:hypothetical protein